jgi:hypothetical protein
MPQEFIQDGYPDEYSHCYGCGRLNDHGLRIHSRIGTATNAWPFSSLPRSTSAFRDSFTAG